MKKPRVKGVSRKNGVNWARRVHLTRRVSKTPKDAPNYAEGGGTTKASFLLADMKSETMCVKESFFSSFILLGFIPGVCVWGGCV